MIMKLKKVYNRFIPLRGYVALTQIPFIFVRESARHKYNDVADRHERIHARQQLEITPLIFDLLYVLFYIIMLIRYRDRRVAYMNNPFEREAYANQDNGRYLSGRSWCSWVRYIRNHCE